MPAQVTPLEPTPARDLVVNSVESEFRQRSIRARSSPPATRLLRLPGVPRSLKRRGDRRDQLGMRPRSILQDGDADETNITGAKHDQNLWGRVLIGSRGRARHNELGTSVFSSMSALRDKSRSTRPTGATAPALRATRRGVPLSRR